jgi:toxin ParE1/3/4
MARVLRTHQAEIDLVEILIPLYERSAAAGDRLGDRIEQRYERLARLPEVGSRCEDLAPRLRFSVIGKYVIYYPPVEDGIQVVRVVHGGRDLRRIFPPRKRLAAALAVD